MALPHEGVVLRHTFTNLLPVVLVLDFFENYTTLMTPKMTYMKPEHPRTTRRGPAGHDLDSTGGVGLSGMVFLGSADSGQQTLAESLARHPDIHTTWHEIQNR